MSAARDIALSAHEQAKAAAEMEALHEEAHKMDAERTKRLMHKADFEAALPILNEWFPGVDWEFMAGEDYGGYDTIVMDAGEKDWPPSFKLRVDRLLIDMNAPEAGHKVKIEVGDYLSDTSPGTVGYRYFSGSEVKSAADVGRYLERKDANQA